MVGCYGCGDGARKKGADLKLDRIDVLPEREVKHSLFSTPTLTTTPFLSLHTTARFLHYLCFC